MQASNTLPLLPGVIDQYFIPSPVPMEKVQYRPWLVGTARVRFFNQRRNIDQNNDVCLRLPAEQADTTFNWEEAEISPVQPDTGMQAAQSGSSFFPVSPELIDKRNITVLKKEFSDFLYHGKLLRLLRVASLKLESNPGESEEQFHLRLASLLSKKKEVEVQKIEKRFSKKQQQLQDRLEKAAARLDKEKSDVTARGVDTALSFGMAVFGALFGRKGFSVSNANRSVRGVRSAGRLMKEKGDVQRVEQELYRSEQELQVLASELQGALSAVADRFDPAQYTVETFAITPRRNDIFSVALYLLWEPDFDFSDEEAG